MAKFLAKCTFALEGRNLFVIGGDVVEGVVRPGMLLHVPFNGQIQMTALIAAVEILSTIEVAEVGVCISADAEEREFWKGLRIAVDGPEGFEVGETGQA